MENLRVFVLEGLKDEAEAITTAALKKQLFYI